jgi:hypothetical protein
MCFSPGADLVAGIVVTAVGVDTVRHAGHRREAPLAVLPLVFGIHQLIEVPVWWGADGGAGHDLAGGAALLYLAIAFGLLPWAVPLAVRHLEPDRTRRAVMALFAVIGLAVAIALMVPTVAGPITVIDMGNHLDYSVPLSYGGQLTALYVVATCGALLLSSDQAVAVYGAVNLAVVVTLAVLLATGVISLWCVWAAVSSVAIALHLRRRHFVDSGPVTNPVR